MVTSTSSWPHIHYTLEVLFERYLFKKVDAQQLVIHGTVGMRNQQNLYPKSPTVVAKLIQYSGSRVELMDGFS